MEHILASESPRRQELLGLILPRFRVEAAHVDEDALQARDEKARLAPILLPERLARAKAQAVFALHPEAAVIGCDTIVALDGQVLGKPRGEAEVLAMLRALSGRRHQVHTGVCLLAPGVDTSFTETTGVHFAPLPEKALAAYAKTPEPLDKAGAYGIQGWAARFIPQIEGDYYNVMGLPVAALYAALAQAGLLAED